MSAVIKLYDSRVLLTLLFASTRAYLYGLSTESAVYEIESEKLMGDGGGKSIELCMKRSLVSEGEKIATD